MLMYMRGRKSLKFWILCAIGIASVAALGSGAYAAFGGNSRPQSVTDVELQRGLIGQWKLDSNARDSTPFQRHGVLTGTTDVADRKGKAGSAKFFNGTSDNIQINPFDLTVMKQSAYSASWTLSIWAKAGTNNADNVLLGKAGCNGGIVSDGNIGYAFAFWNGACNTATTLKWAPANLTTTWHHIVATYSNGALKLYGDGQLITTGTAPSPFVDYEDMLRIGSGFNGFYFNGSLDDARVYNRALNATEAKALYEQYDLGAQLMSGGNGLVGQWKMDGNARDYSPYANNGTITAATATADRKGRANGAYSFNASTSYIDIPDKTEYNSRVGSWSAWIYANSTPASSASIMSKMSPTGSRSGINIYHSGAGKLSVQIKDAAANEVNTSTTGPSLTTGVWHHVAVTFSGDGPIYVYLDGAQVSTLTPPVGWSFATSSPVRLAKAVDSFWSLFGGNIDDVRIYNRVLTPAQVKQLNDSYDSQININSAPTTNTTGGNINQGLLAFYPFSGNARDATPYANNGTVSGATLTTDRKGRANSAYLQTANSLISVGSPATLSTLASTGFTYSIWLMRTGTSPYNWPEIMGSQDTHTGYGIRSQSFGDAITFEFGLPPYDGANGNFTSVGSSLLPVNEWHMFTATYVGGTVSFYKDGSLVYANSGFTLNPSFPGLQFNYGPTNLGWVGSIDDPRVYNRSLSSSEVQALYTATK